MHRCDVSSVSTKKATSFTSPNPLSTLPEHESHLCFQSLWTFLPFLGCSIRSHCHSSLSPFDWKFGSRSILKEFFEYDLKCSITPLDVIAPWQEHNCGGCCRISYGCVRPFHPSAFSVYRDRSEWDSRTSGFFRRGSSAGKMIDCETLLLAITGSLGLAWLS